MNLEDEKIFTQLLLWFQDLSTFQVYYIQQDIQIS